MQKICRNNLKAHSEKGVLVGVNFNLFDQSPIYRAETAVAEMQPEVYT